MQRDEMVSRQVPMKVRSLRWAAMASLLALGACGGGGDGPATPAEPPAVALACDDGLKTAFAPDVQTSVLLVKEFKQGDPLLLSGTANGSTPTAPLDVCLVKLLVGPGNPGPVGAPSTSAGIGLEVWLPKANVWNERIRAMGNGGWAGSNETSLTQLSGAGEGVAHKAGAMGKGYVVSTSDNGHVGGASFAMNPDGTINSVLWQDFAERSLHEQAVKTKALTKVYYGKAHRFAYWDGFSTGGRQGMKLAQVYPQHFDGVLSGAPAINWSRFIMSELYPQVAMRQDLGTNIANAKITAASTAAINACGGAALGFLIDPLSCRYDPTRDAGALCTGEIGGGGVVGTNGTAASCLTAVEAQTMNKIWYGQTANGTAPDPAADNGAGPFLATSNHLWFGLTRGTNLGALAGSNAISIASDLLALHLQNPAYGGPGFVNATGNGTNLWTALTYGDLTNATLQGSLLQSNFGNINTDNPDLSGFKARKGKVLMYHGLADNLIMPQGSLNYFHRVAGQMGGIPAIQDFFRLYLIPGLSHAGRLTGTATTPLPQAPSGRDELFTALRDWVESGTVPGRMEVRSSNDAVSLPLCVYPLKITYNGSGLETDATSYSCL
ncbi:MAG: tannase/feruloyl esterase family alpha/beta hydrolase [Hydrogenophaga sp.]|nr:tannase/feruloyl esterase family alpha/beta hydrolase [Hydrogenophaga sp.]